MGATLSAGGIIVEGIVNSNYLDIPFLLRLYVANGFNIFLGPQFSYHLNSNFVLKVDAIEVIDREATSDTISEFGLAPVLGFGYEFDSGFNSNLSGDLEMFSVDWIGNLPTFNRNIRCSLGYSY